MKTELDQIMVCVEEPARQQDSALNIPSESEK